MPSNPKPGLIVEQRALETAAHYVGAVPKKSRLITQMLATSILKAMANVAAINMSNGICTEHMCICHFSPFPTKDTYMHS
jgi:hypothetical protein